MMDATQREIARQTNEALLSGEYDQVLLVGHSQGGIKVAGAMGEVRPELRESVDTITFDSAHTKPLLGVASHVDVHRERDFVSDHAGHRRLRNALQPVTNGLGLTNSRHEALPYVGDGKVCSIGMGLAIRNAHGYMLHDFSGKPRGYNSRIPAIIRDIAIP